MHERSSELSSIEIIARYASVGVPVPWNIHIRAVKFLYRRATEQAQRAIDIGAQDFDGAIDAGFSTSGEAVSVGASAEHGASAEAKGFDNVGAAADTAIEQDFDLPVDGLDHLRQRAQ